MVYTFSASKNSGGLSLDSCPGRWRPGKEWAVLRAPSVFLTTVRNCVGDEGRSLSSTIMVVIAETSGHDPVRHGRERRASSDWVDLQRAAETLSGQESNSGRDGLLPGQARQLQLMRLGARDRFLIAGVGVTHDPGRRVVP